MPPRPSVCLGLSLALAACAGLARGQEDAAARSAAGSEAAEIARRALGRDFSGLEAWRIRAEATGAAFLIARRTVDGRAQVAIDVVEPPQFRNHRMLLLQNEDRSDDLFWIPNHAGPRTKWRIERLPAIDLTSRLPQLPGNVALLDVRPFRADELDHARVGEETIGGELCDVISSTPTGKPAFDRLEQAVSRRTGVALRRSWFRGDREFRRDLVAPGDVEQHEGRWLAMRTRIESPPGRSPTELTLERLRETSELPDRLFQHRALLTRRFPSL
jgi:hypothetical protein